MRYYLLFILFIFSASAPVWAQETMSFGDITFTLGDSWSEVADVNVHPESGKAESTDGSGVLLNLPSKRNKGEDIYSTEEYGNVDLSFYYLMFPGSNSGVYLQGNYEVQLMDSWGVQHPTYGDNGGIYQRWTEEGTGYEGRAPMQNASRAPGIWQHMVISFTAPVFSDSGEKISNARISVSLNGVPVHTDVELTGPTRGARSGEKSRGPIRIQGDHGPVAFRDMTLITYDNPRPELKDLSFTAYKGKFIDEPDYESLPPEAMGEIPMLTAEVSPSPNDFLIRYSGTLNVQTAGTYHFEAGFPGGSGTLIVNEQTVVPFTGWGGEGTVTLPAGNVPLEVRYAKVYEWIRPGLSLRAEGPGIRMTELADASANVASVVDPIYLEAPNVLRSFMDIPEEGRVVRAVSVGSAEDVHYTYDMDNAAIVHAWRGKFLDTTPMWHDRGDGSSRPRGSLCYLDGTAPPVQPMAAEWKTDTTGLHFHINGYRQGADQAMTFMYALGSASVEDHIRPMDSGKGLTRTLNISGNSSLYIRIGQGEKISRIARGMYRISGRGNYYVKTDDSTDARIRLTPDGDMELIAPIGSSFTYSILF